jgi:type II secretory ATPase GspE/PulE/Tfp pilus assembly ATPase PilB-like protein
MEAPAAQAEAVPKYLVDLGFVTPDMAAAAAGRQKASGERFTTALVLGGSAAGEDLVRGLSRRNGEDAIDVDGHCLHPRLINLIPEPVAFEYKILPLHRTQNVLFAAVPQPWMRSRDLSKLEKQLGLHVEPVPVEEMDVPGLVVKCHQLLRARSMRERRTGQALVERGLLSAQELQQGLALQKQKGGRLGQALVELGFLSEPQLYQVLSERLRVPLLTAPQLGERLNPSLAKRVTQAFAEHNMILPFNQDAAALHVACSFPCDPNVMETLKSIFGVRKISFFMVDEAGLRQVIGAVFGGGALPAAAKGGGSMDLTTEVAVTDVDIDVKDMDADEYKDPEIPKIVNYMLYQAVKKAVSDIHIEQYEGRADVKFRIDGQLRSMSNMPITAENVVRVISKIKIDAKLDIAERRKPQDGSFRKRLGEKLIVDFRLAIQPTIYGENAVIRVLDRTSPLPTLNQLGMPDDMLRKYLRTISNPQGMIIFTGPTGSGKTTTLYCTLEVLRKQSLKIITAEDPIEYMFDGIQQCQVMEQIGNTFAKYLRGFLRQDPDVILIGEIRDQETAIMATRAAVTGHLLFTTIHATDSVGVVRRIVDMGVDANMLSMSLLTVVYQRLLRRICPNCKSEYKEDPAVLEDLQLKEILKDAPLYKGVGCESCDNEGYRGRIAVYEYWELPDECKDQIAKEPDDRKIRQLAFQLGLKPMVVDALAKVRQGVTTLAELQEVVPYNQIVKAKDFVK